MAMKCSSCKVDDFNEVLIIKKDKIKSKLPKYQNLDRVCLSCGKRLAKKGVYELGTYWKGVLLSIEMHK